ncbi:MAG TPA: hypothetical protein VFE24_03785 [Pirellulales bacterium]|nr:hypothetical protein [Pirellulales bacterium]
MGVTGLEESHDLPGKTGGGTQSGAPVAQVQAGDPDLRQVIEAWPRLTATDRQQIVKLATAAKKRRRS